MSEPYDEAEEYLDGDQSDQPGCWNCDGGWRHGCMDDMCRGASDAIDCQDAFPCRLCNPRGLFGF